MFILNLIMDSFLISVNIAMYFFMGKHWWNLAAAWFIGGLLTAIIIQKIADS